MSTIDHPDHYNITKTETIKIIEEFCSDDEYKGFLKGNILKYIHRYYYKGGVEDLKKAQWYLNALIECEETAD